jgi:hypothetical protein
LVRGDQPHRFAAVAVSLQGLIHTMVTAVSARVRHEPAVSLEPNVYPGSVAGPVDAIPTT